MKIYDEHFENLPSLGDVVSLWARPHLNLSIARGQQCPGRQRSYMITGVLFSLYFFINSMPSSDIICIAFSPQPKVGFFICSNSCGSPSRYDLKNGEADRGRRACRLQPSSVGFSGRSLKRGRWSPWQGLQAYLSPLSGLWGTRFFLL